ncbi:universal stress protein, partial [Bacteroides heparinolyticus]
MEEKLVTLAILTYVKAQILKNVLENEGIETYIHNVNQIQPVVSSGVRVRIKESDLPHALRITESSSWLSEEVVGGKTPKIEKNNNKVLIPVDFSGYSLKACEFGFNLAQNIDAEAVLLHVYFTPIYA